LDILQEQIARSLGSGPRFLHGLAGTGKTLILLFHSKLAYTKANAQNKKIKILFLCWNISLAQYLRHVFDAFNFPVFAGNRDSKVEIMHFAAFARKLLYKTPGVRFPRTINNPNFDQELTEALHDVYVDFHDRYDIVYVDEVQDFQKDWIKFIFDNLLIGEPKDRNLILAGDYAQQVYKYRDFARTSGFTWKSLGIPMVGRAKNLYKIFRNSARVYSFARAFIGDISNLYKNETDEDIQISFAPKRGFDPQLIQCDTIKDQIDKVVDILSRLDEHNYSPRNAMILYRGKTYNKYPLIEELRKKLDKAGIPNQWITEDSTTKATFKWKEESVKISTVHSAKGMDSPVVIVLAAEAFKENKNSEDDEEKILYVALTRAREFIMVLHTEEKGQVQRLKNAMKEYKKHRKQILGLEKLSNEPI